MKRVLASLSPLVLAAGLVVAVAAPAEADDRECTGTIRATTIDGNVIVPQGERCVLIGTRVDDNVHVEEGATLVAKGARIGGSIQAENHRKVRVVPRFVDGDARRSVVGGNIQAKQGGGGEIRRTKVGADIQLFSNDGRFEVYRNVVGGNLQCKSNDPKPVGDNNRVEGNKEDQCAGF